MSADWQAWDAGNVPPRWVESEKTAAKNRRNEEGDDATSATQLTRVLRRDRAPAQ